MTQYQSFPDASGDSRTLEKLKALKLPELGGLGFLDVGCHEGFFCGFAKFLGASRAVVIDQSVAFLERARARFPAFNVLHQGCAPLPERFLDVIPRALAPYIAREYR